MTGDDLRRMRERYRLSQAELGRYLRKSPKTIMRREALGNRPLPIEEAIAWAVIEMLFLKPKLLRELEAQAAWDREVFARLPKES